MHDEANPAADPQPENKPASPSRRRFLRRLLFGGLVLGVPTAGYAHELEPERIQVVTLDVPIPGLPPEAHGLRIGHMSDTHCDSPRAVERAARAARLLMAQKPDVVCLTGDYITHQARSRMAPAADALRPLSEAPQGAFAILGNHDWWAGDPDFVTTVLHRVGFTVLRNASAPIRGTGVWAVGLEQRCDSRQNPTLALHGVPRDALRLLLIHEPDYADESPAGFALQLSGHSHGGQVRIPGLPPPIVPRYSRRYPEGLRRGPRHLVYTTRGVGMVGPKFRLFCPPEVAILRLVSAPQSTV
jgi:uncharacterized protein